MDRQTRETAIESGCITVVMDPLSQGMVATDSLSGGAEVCSVHACIVLHALEAMQTVTRLSECVFVCAYDVAQRAP